MKRLYAQLAVLLIIGAIVNVAIAWTCAAWVDVKERPAVVMSLTASPRPNDVLRWQVRRADGFGRQEFGFTRNAGQRVSARVAQFSGQDATPDFVLPYWCDPPPEFVRSTDHTILHVAAGWPMRSLRAHCIERDARWTYPLRPMTQTEVQRIGVTREPLWRSAWVIEDQFVGGPFSARALPLKPIWFGFAVNSILYAAVFWALLFGPAVLRRKRRLKHGLCIHCAYDLRGAPPDSENCPECGAAILRTSREPAAAARV